MQISLSGASNEEIGRRIGGFSGVRLGKLLSIGNGITYLDDVRPVTNIIRDRTS
ncbi:MAG: hypothetical protein HDQ87_04070 [Clostridia bacterium]|nr:hypothetical protein [Clostridia bacterium]